MVDNPIRLYMSMSLDGYIAGPDDRPGRELGRDGRLLFDWLGDRESDGSSGRVFGELMATGAVISGRRTFELARRWHGDYHDGVPVVLTHRADPRTRRPATRGLSPTSRPAPARRSR